LGKVREKSRAFFIFTAGIAKKHFCHSERSEESLFGNLDHFFTAEIAKSAEFNPENFLPQKAPIF
jgi:hypothetical protein